MALFLELLVAGLVIAVLVLFPISFWASKLLVRDPPDFASLFRISRAQIKEARKRLASPRD